MGLIGCPGCICGGDAGCEPVPVNTVWTTDFGTDLNPLNQASGNEVYPSCFWRQSATGATTALIDSGVLKMGAGGIGAAGEIKLARRYENFTHPVGTIIRFEAKFVTATGSRATTSINMGISPGIQLNRVSTTKVAITAGSYNEFTVSVADGDRIGFLATHASTNVWDLSVLKNGTDVGSVTGVSFTANLFALPYMWFSEAGDNFGVTTVHWDDVEFEATD